VNYGTSTPLFPEVVPFKGEVLGKNPELKFADYDFNERKKYLQFASDQYLKQVHYLDNRVIRLGPQQWENGLV